MKLNDLKAKALVKILEKLIVKALEQEGKEPTTENIEAFIDDALNPKEEKTCGNCKHKDTCTSESFCFGKDWENKK